MLNRDGLFPLERPWKEALAVYGKRLGVMVGVAVVILAVALIYSLFGWQEALSCAGLVMAIVVPFVQTLLFEPLRKRTSYRYSKQLRIHVLSTVVLVGMIIYVTSGDLANTALTSVIMAAITYYKIQRERDSQRERVLDISSALWSLQRLLMLAHSYPDNAAYLRTKAHKELRQLYASIRDLEEIRYHEYDRPEESFRAERSLRVLKEAAIPVLLELIQSTEEEVVRQQAQEALRHLDSR